MLVGYLAACPNSQYFSVFSGRERGCPGLVNVRNNHGGVSKHLGPLKRLYFGSGPLLRRHRKHGKLRTTMVGMCTTSEG